MTDVVRALGGGALIGLAASLALLLHGRIAGVTGIIGRAIDRDGGSEFRIGFLLGLIATGAILAGLTPGAFGAPLRSIPVHAVAGLLVGLGTTLANGCTSGHGVCGISRFSTRSFVAVATFMLTGGLTVALIGARS